MKDLFLVGARLLGLALLIQALSSLTYLGIGFSATVQFGKTVTASLGSLPWILVIQIVLMLLAAWLLLFYAEGIADRLKIPDSQSPITIGEVSLLLLGIQLMGLWLLVTGTLGTLDAVVRIAFSNSLSGLQAWSALSKGITLCAGLWMARAPWMIAGMIRRAR